MVIMGPMNKRDMWVFIQEKRKIEESKKEEVERLRCCLSRTLLVEPYNDVFVATFFNALAGK